MKVEYDHYFVSTLAIVMAYSVIDAVMTYLMVSHGIAEESNPIMMPLMNSAASFFFVKITMCLLGCFVLWRCRRHNAAKAGLAVAFFCYFAVVMAHLYGGLLFLSTCT